MAPASDRTTGLAFPYFSAKSSRRPGPLNASTAGTAAARGAGATAAAQREHGAGPSRRHTGHWAGRSTPPV
jgi:hypothetical protein